MKVLFCLVAVAFVASVYGIPTLRDPTPPTWPSQFFLAGTFQIPYFNIVEPLEAWSDAVDNKQRFDYYGGRTSFLFRYDLKWGAEVVPRIDKKVCMSNNISGPTATGGVEESPLKPILPDITTWTYNGTASVNNVTCDQWYLQVQNETKVATYIMYVDAADGKTPVRLYLDGLNFIDGSHPDIYIMDYSVFVPSVDGAAFDIPDLCHMDDSVSPFSVERFTEHMNRMVSRIGKIIPPRHTCNVSPAFLLWIIEHGKHYGPCSEYAHREKIWLANQKYIAEHNANPASTHKLKMNHLGDLTDEDFRRTLSSRGRPADNKAHKTHTREMYVKDAPASMDWRDHGAVSMVKDQGVCGSCWTFGVIGSLEGVWMLKTGTLLSMSEQQVMDCAWGYKWGGPGGNLACDGGYASGAFQWLIDNGGNALESAYPYEMQDGWCNPRDHSAEGVKVTGYVNVTGVDDLINAVGTVGPVAIAFDASHPSLRFYASGIYTEPLCKSDIDSLDHEVLAVGYGTDNGQDYWILKNSWSTHWGDNGYMKITRDNNMCGVATQATYPIV